MTSRQPRFFASPAEFRQWLEKHAATAPELQVGYWKIATGRPSTTWPESVDEALCFGWIDSVRRRIDEQAYQIRFTPRQPGSVWSAVNIRKFEQLNAQGRMTDAGRRAYANRTEPTSSIYSDEQPLPAELTEAETRAARLKTLIEASADGKRLR